MSIADSNYNIFGVSNSQVEGIKSSCNQMSFLTFLSAILNVFQEQPRIDIESNRSSAVFERSHTHRNQQPDAKTPNSEDCLRITTLRDLLRLFRKANDTFEYNGQRYSIELEDTFSSSQSPRVSHNRVYDQKQPKSMPNGTQSAESHFSPINFNSDSKKDDSEQEDISSRLEEVRVGQTLELEVKTTPLMKDQEIQIDVKDLESNAQQEVNPVSAEVKLEPDNFYADIAKQLALEIEMEEEVLRLEEEQKLKLQKEEEEKRQKENAVMMPDSFYADIAKQLALEIEMEEEKDKEEEEERQKKLQAQQNQPEPDNFYADIQKQLALQIELELMEEEEKQEPKSATSQMISHHKNQSEFTTGSSSSGNLIKSIDATLNKKSTNNMEINRDSLAQALSAAADNPKFARSMSVADNKGEFKFNKAKIKEMDSEKQLLLQQLSQAKQQLEQLESLNSMFIGKGQGSLVGDAPLHLAFLFASPLVIRSGGIKGQNSKDNFNTIPLLEFGKEFQEIKASIKETGHLIKVRHKQATIDNLTKILIQNPLALHFSGHGLENNKENFGRQYKQRLSDGNYLLFETEDGECELVSEKMLQDFIQSSNTKLEFVFVASCYSEFAGKIFLNTGAKHVVCVRSGEQIADLAVITFSKSFYNSVFSQSMTICDSFKIAQKQVQVKYGLAEASKFSILIRNEGSPVTTSSLKSKLSPSFSSEPNFSSQNSYDPNHKCKIFGPLHKGEVEFLEPKPRFKEFPAKVDKFLGRQKELFEVVHNVLNHRLVTIIGLPGIGKTSLTKNAVHYMAERKVFGQGIIFLQLKGFMSLELFMKKLIVNFVRQNFDLEEEDKKQVENTEHLLSLSLKYLKQQEDNLLIVFDNVEDLLYYDKLAFRILINDLLMQVPNLHILMTSRTTLGALQDISEKILVLQELSPFFTVELFVSRSREISDEEVKDLLDCRPENYILVGDHGVKKNQKINNLTEHHLFKILGGNPHAIILAAPLLIKMKLKELYLLINSKEMHDVLQVDGIKDSTVASLRLSLEASIKILQKEDEECLQFFFLIGMLPGGIEEEELEEFGGPNYKEHIDKLINFSLLQKKESQNEKTKYILPPFMSNYAEAKISQEDKLIFQNDICHYYAKVCKKILSSNGKSIKSKQPQADLSHEIMSKLVKHETNIWACIYRMVDTPAPELDMKLDQETIRNDVNQRMRRISTIINPQGIGNLGGIQRTSTQIIIDSMKPTSPNKKQKTFGVKEQKKLNDLSDTADQRPFEIMVSQTPRMDDQKCFNFPVENEQKSSHSAITSSLTLMNIKEEEDCKSSQNSDDIHTDSEDDEESGSDASPDASPKKVFGNLQTNQEQQLKDIIRNSYVNFQRPSIVGNQILSMIKSPDIEKKVMQRRMTLIGKNDFLPNLTQNKGHQSFRQQRVKVEELHDAEKMIIYYVMNLFLLRENDSALQLINDYAFKAHGSQLYEANLHRVMGLIWHNKVEVQKSLDSFKKAKQIYASIGSKYGEALSKFSIGYIYRSKIAEFIIKTDEEVVLKRSKACFESAMTLFKEVNHIVGIGLCHQQLSLIELKLQNKKESNDHSRECLRYMKLFTNYTNKKDCPHIQRVHGNEISLMSEIVNDNDNKNLFPQGNSGSTKPVKKKTQGLIQTQNSSEMLNECQIQVIQHNASLQAEDLQIHDLEIKMQDSLTSSNLDQSPMKREDSSQPIELDFFEVAIQQDQSKAPETSPQPFKKQATNQYKRPQISLEVVQEEEETKEQLKKNAAQSKGSTTGKFHSHKQSQQFPSQSSLKSTTASVRKRSFDKKASSQSSLLNDSESKEAALNRSAKKPAQNSGKPKQIKTSLVKK